MNRFLILSFATIILVMLACKDNINEPIDLNGEWVSQINDRIVFSFNNNKCSYIWPSGNFATYQLKNNTIVISDTINRRKKKNVEVYKFKIDEFKNGLMTLITDTSTLNSHFKYSDSSLLDTFHLKKLKNSYNNKFSSIEFESSRCFGSCPSMKLNIDSLGNVQYEGRAYTEKNGYYTGMLPDDKMETLIRKIDYINLDSIKPNYSAMWTDDQTLKLTMKFDKGLVKTRVYGFNNEPIELRILFNELMEMYKSIDMKQDSLHEYYFDDLF